MAESMYGIPTQLCFDFGYAALAAVIIWLLLVHQRRRIPLVPESASGRARLLYVTFLWIMVVANFERALVGFAPQRLVTEGVIFLNAVLCTGICLGITAEGA